MEGGYNPSLPVSHHHPKCEDYKLVKFARITYEGQPVIVPENEVQGYIDDITDNGITDYTMLNVWMTQDQFERMPELAGF